MRALRFCRLILLVTLLGGSLPVAPLQATVLVPPPLSPAGAAIVDDGADRLPRPAAAQSTSLATAVATALMDALDATETAPTTFDGTFSQGVRHEVWRDDGTYTLQNQTERIIDVPSGYHTSLEVDTTTVHVTGNWAIGANIAVRAKGTTQWKSASIVGSHGANTTAVKHNVRFTA